MRRRVEASTPGVRRVDSRALIAAALIAASCGAAPVKDKPGSARRDGSSLSAKPAGDPRAVLALFLDAAGRGDFEACWRLLASPLRERYTPSRLAEDFHAAGRLSQDKLARARAVLQDEPRIKDDTAELPVSDRTAIRLVLESGGWRIVSLE